MPHRAFSLLEVLVAMTIFGLAMGVALVAFVAVLKRVHHTDAVLKGAAELRHATDVISQVVRSAPQPPVVQSGGLELLVAPRDLGYATVLATTWIDVLHDVKGSKSNQRMLHISNVAGSAVSTSVFAGFGRPAGSVSTSGLAAYFATAADLPTIDLNDVFSAGDEITIPATAYGAQVTREIRNISNNPGNKTLTLTSDLGVDVPNGTRIAATAGRRHRFILQADGELRHYPDHRDLTRYAVLAREIDPSPLSNPADASSAVSVPFIVTERAVSINLQRIPAGSTSGRTVQGAQTTVFTRTDPLIP